MSFAEKWMELEIIMLSKKRQYPSMMRERDKRQERDLTN
jgi:hypothetical protein